MDNRERAQYLADFALDTCCRCESSEGACHQNARIGKCLMSDHITGRLDHAVYTVRRNFITTDFRHWNFDDNFSPDELADVLRGNVEAI